MRRIDAPRHPRPPSCPAPASKASSTTPADRRFAQAQPRRGRAPARSKVSTLLHAQRTGRRRREHSLGCPARRDRDRARSRHEPIAALESGPNPSGRRHQRAARRTCCAPHAMERDPRVRRPGRPSGLVVLRRLAAPVPSGREASGRTSRSSGDRGCHREPRNRRKESATASRLDSTAKFGTVAEIPQRALPVRNPSFGAANGA